MLKEQADNQVNQFYSDEWGNNSSQSVDQKIPSQQSARTDRFVGNAFQRKRNQDRDDDRVENNG